MQQRLAFFEAGNTPFRDILCCPSFDLKQNGAHMLETNSVDEYALELQWQRFLESLDSDDVLLSGAILLTLQCKKDLLDRETQGLLF
jgi:hypothetical protein